MIGTHQIPTLIVSKLFAFRSLFRQL
uniref:Uncharacterized protein n=1 Tax=Rhizophora mucronata TaxID=61149 RepID=A0A2P2R2V3_RHIMU